MANTYLFTPSASNYYRCGSVGIRAAVAVADSESEARSAITNELHHSSVSGEVHLDLLDVVTVLTSGDGVLFKGTRFIPPPESKAIGSEGSH